jgi:hypothetical protein
MAGIPKNGRRNELAGSVDPDPVTDLIAGALLLRAARRGGEVDDSFEQAVCRWWSKACPQPRNLDHHGAGRAGEPCRINDQRLGSR